MGNRHSTSIIRPKHICIIRQTQDMRTKTDHKKKNKTGHSFRNGSIPPSLLLLLLHAAKCFSPLLTFSIDPVLEPVMLNVSRCRSKSYMSWSISLNKRYDRSDSWPSATGQALCQCWKSPFHYRYLQLIGRSLKYPSCRDGCWCNSFVCTAEKVCYHNASKSQCTDRQIKQLQPPWRQLSTTASQRKTTFVFFSHSCLNS